MIKKLVKTTLSNVYLEFFPMVSKTPRSVWGLAPEVLGDERMVRGYVRLCLNKLFWRSDLPYAFFTKTSKSLFLQFCHPLQKKQSSMCIYFHLKCVWFTLLIHVLFYPKCHSSFCGKPVCVFSDWKSKPIFASNTWSKRATTYGRKYLS